MLRLFKGLVLGSSAFFLIQLQTAQAASTEEVWVKHNSDQQFTEYLVIHPEAREWYVDLYRKPDNDLQDHIWQRVFQTESSARKFIEGATDGFAPKAPTGSDETGPSSITLIPPKQSVWEVQHQWDLQWEEAYAKWVETTIKPDFFKKYGISTDCAKVIIASRWIFARISGLPAANRLAGSEVLFTQDSYRESWGELTRDPVWYKDKLFRAALNYLLSNTYTHSLFRDSYPVAIVPAAIRPGTLHLSLVDDSGHTLLVSATHLGAQDGPPLLVSFSGVPRAVRVIWTSGYWDSEPPTPQTGGFMWHRWPVQAPDGSWSLMPATGMPYFSMEQYDPAFTKGHLGFWEAVLLKFNPQINYTALLTQAVTDLEDQVWTREDVVDHGFDVCQKQACTRGTDNWENWSTPSRDARIGEMIDITQILAKRGGSPADQILKTALSDSLFKIDGRDYTLQTVFDVWKAKTYDSDPRNPPAARWGMK